MTTNLGDIAQLIEAIAICLSVWLTWRNGRGIERVHLATNSMKDALVESTAKASLLEGTAAGLEQGRNETRDPPSKNPD